MASVSSIVKKIVSQNKLLQEGMRQELLSYGAVADTIKRKVENEFGAKVKESAIVMALRRFSEMNAKKESEKRLAIKSEIIMKTGLGYMSIRKDPTFLEKLEKFYKKLDHEKGTFNVIQGNYEIQILTNEKYISKIKQLLGSDMVIAEENDLVSISLTLGKEFAHTPGILFEVTRKLYWEDVNIFELLTTATELTLIFQQKYATKAYEAINDLIRI